FRQTPYFTPALPRAQDTPFADARGHPPLIEEFEERYRIFSRNAQQILDVARPDLLALAQERHELGLDGVERLRMEEERLLDPHELAGLDENLEQLMLLVAAHPCAPERFLGARRSGLGAAELALEGIDHPLLLRRQAHLVGRETNFVALGLHDALRAERREQEGEHPLVGPAGAAAELLAGHAGLQRTRAVEGRELVEHQAAHPAHAL